MLTTINRFWLWFTAPEMPWLRRSNRRRQCLICGQKQKRERHDWRVIGRIIYAHCKCHCSAAPRRSASGAQPGEGK